MMHLVTFVVAVVVVLDVAVAVVVVALVWVHLNHHKTLQIIFHLCKCRTYRMRFRRTNARANEPTYIEMLGRI